MFENRMLIKIFGPKGDEMIGWSQLHNEELHNLYSSPNMIRMARRMRWMEHVAHMGEK
jgi:hypothetical protein